VRSSPALCLFSFSSATTANDDGKHCNSIWCPWLFLPWPPFPPPSVPCPTSVSFVADGALITAPRPLLLSAPTLSSPVEGASLANATQAACLLLGFGWLSPAASSSVLALLLPPLLLLFLPPPGPCTSGGKNLLIPHRNIVAPLATNHDQASGGNDSALEPPPPASSGNNARRAVATLAHCLRCWPCHHCHWQGEAPPRHHCAGPVWSPQFPCATGTTMP
jgi:hypothetical protein